MHSKNENHTSVLDNADSPTITWSSGVIPHSLLSPPGPPLLLVPVAPLRDMKTTEYGSKCWNLNVYITDNIWEVMLISYNNQQIYEKA